MTLSGRPFERELFIPGPAIKLIRKGSQIDMKKIIALVIVLALAAAAYGFIRNKNSVEAQPLIDFAEITRGDIENVISCTGTIEPVRTVAVGTEVSGKIDKIFVDFNDNVKKGQVLAVLDTTFLQSSIRDANASIVRADAQYRKAEKDYEHNKELFDQHYVSELELLSFETTMKSNFASLQSAQSALERAQFNLDHALICSPISGKVINRNVEEGQTVAASFSTPTLFQIAEDLSKIQILAAVDESDIGQIKEGQEVRFSVESYFDKKFQGAVREVRLQPKMVSNVVTYTVVVDAENKEGLLLPGMTATLDFVVEKKENVLLVPSSALRIQPTEEMLAAMRRNWTGRQRPGDSTGQRQRDPNARRQGDPNTQRQWDPSSGEGRRSGPPDGNGNWGGRGQRENMARLCTKDDQGNYSAIPVRKGITDGLMTEILENDRVHEGQKVMSSVIQVAEKQNNSNGPRLDMRVMGRALGR